MPTDYRLSARVFLPKALLQKKLSNQKPTAILQFAIQEEQRNAECGARLKNFHSSNLLCICLSLLVTNLNKAKYSIYEKLSTVFSVAGFRFEEKQSHQLHYFNPVADPEEGPGPPLIFRPNKKFFWRPAPPRPPQPKGLDDRPPTYLKVWIRHCNQPIFSCNENPFFFGIW